MESYEFLTMGNLIQGKTEPQHIMYQYIQCFKLFPFFYSIRCTWVSYLQYAGVSLFQAVGFIWECIHYRYELCVKEIRPYLRAVFKF